LPEGFHLHERIAQALEAERPVVALESTVLTHGLPYPQNLDLARDMETMVTDNGAIPATIAVLDGQVWVGASAEQLGWLVMAPGLHKISSRDLSAAISLRWSGGTTVAGTLVAAHRAGIRVFATGGIGGVHRDAERTFDVSQDLLAIARAQVAVVSAGAKAILDLPRTLEALESLGVPVIGYGTSQLPAFYTNTSGLKLEYRVEDPAQAAALLSARWDVLGQGGVVLANPVPQEADAQAVHEAIDHALRLAEERGIRGKAVTPFLLEQVAAHTGGESLRVNLALLEANARVAAQIAVALRARGS
jgi:pseudouridine-5'-phosphate glycosidase